MSDYDLTEVGYALDGLSGRSAAYATANQYYRGKQKLRFATDAFREAFGATFREFVYNRCGVVIDSVDDRLAISGWESTGQDETGGTENDPVELRAAELWAKSQMTRRQGEVHREALRAGDAYVLVWPDEEDQTPRFYPHKANMMTVLYDQEHSDQLCLAVKTWRIERGPNKGKWRVTVYWPDVVQRFISLSRSEEMPKGNKVRQLIPYEDDGMPAEATHTYGRVPVVHFANKADTGEMGHSELSDIIGLQDSANKIMRDLLLNSEYNSWRQRWIAGVQSVLDPDTGREVPIGEIGMGRTLIFGDKETKVGAFDVSTVNEFTTGVNAFDTWIANSTQTPLHWISQQGTPLSGEALKTQESPFVAKVKNRQISWGDDWGETMALALIEDGVTPDQANMIVPIWASAESRGDQDFWSVAQMKIAGGVPEEQIWQEFGYTPDEIAGFTLQNEAQVTSLADMTARATNAGRIGSSATAGMMPMNGGQMNATISGSMGSR